MSISFSYLVVEEEKEPVVLGKMELYDSINSILYSMGMPMTLSGFRYLSKAIYKLYNDKDFYHRAYKSLYIEIAEEDLLKTTGSCVERCMRTAIEACLNNVVGEEVREPIIGKTRIKKMSITEFTNTILLYMDRNMGL